jgi:predicted MFS family arabinose efflux permease
MLKRCLLLAVPLLLAVSPGLARAQGYDQGDFIAADDLTVVPGQEVTLSGCCFSGEADIDIQSTPRRLGVATADAAGVFTTTVTIPIDITLGAHTITVTGQDIDETGTLVLRLPITVVAPGASDAADTAAGKRGIAARIGAADGAGKRGGALARTGADSLPLIQVGLALLLIGAGTVFSVRNRRNTSPSPRDESTISS